MDGRSLKLFRDVSFPDEAAQLTTTLFSQYNTVFINKFTEHTYRSCLYFIPLINHIPATEFIGFVYVKFGLIPIKRSLVYVAAIGKRQNFVVFCHTVIT
jgi:hypothetical protein